MSPSAGIATIVPASDYVSTFRGEGVEPDLVCSGGGGPRFDRGPTPELDRRETIETCPDMIGVAQPAAPALGVLDHAKR